MNATRHLKCGRVVFTAVTALAALANVAANAITKDDIRDRWQARERAIRSSNLKLDWIERHIRTAPPSGGPVQATVARRQAFPPESDETLQFDTSVLASRGRVLYVRKGLAFYGRIGKMDRCTLTIVWDGKNGRELQAFDNEHPAVGEIASTTYDLSDWTLRPLFLSMWPSEPSFGGIDLSSYETDADPRVFNGVECVVLKASDAKTVESEVWIDPKRDCVIVRIVGRSGLQVARQIDIRYQNLESVGWVPESWQMSINRPGTNDISFRCDGELKELSIVDQLADSLFELNFPRQSTVYDVSASSHGNGQEYIVGSDGQLQPVQRGRFGSGANRQIALVGTAILVLVLFAIVMIRRYQSDRGPA